MCDAVVARVLCYLCNQGTLTENRAVEHCPRQLVLGSHVIFHAFGVRGMPAPCAVPAQPMGRRGRVDCSGVA